MGVDEIIEGKAFMDGRCLDVCYEEASRKKKKEEVVDGDDDRKVMQWMFNLFVVVCLVCLSCHDVDT